MNSVLTKLSSVVEIGPQMSILEKLAEGGFGGGATNDPSKFDESVPPMMDQSQGQDPNSPIMTQDQQNQEGSIADSPYAAVPQQPEVAPPVDPGIAAAQAFIGPEIMQAAMGGDMNAANIVGAAAGHIARIANSTPPVDQTGAFNPTADQMMAPPPPQITSAEDDLANAIAPMPNEVLSQVEGGGSQQGQPSTQYA